MQIITRALRIHERDVLVKHFLALDADDRRLRFGQPIGDHAVRNYADSIQFDRDAVFGVFDDELNLAGAAHLARGPGYAELGVSVLPRHRGRGVGDALFARSRLHACNWGVSEMFTHCAVENPAMMRLAGKHGMRIEVERGEADGYLAVPAADLASIASELIAERVGVFDYALKLQTLAARGAKALLARHLAQTRPEGNLDRYCSSRKLRTAPI